MAVEAPPPPAGLVASRPPLPFPAPTFVTARCQPSPFPSYLDEREGFMLCSEGSGRAWHAIRPLRKCQYGTVLQAIEVVQRDGGDWVYEGTRFAIKEMLLERIERHRGSNEDPLKEVAVLQYLMTEGHHPNVMNVTEALRDDAKIYIVMPFCDGGELFDVVAERGRMSEAEARPLFRQLVEGMGFIQGRGICHRDMSLENLMLTRHETEMSLVVVIDFGMALRCPQGPGGTNLRITPQGACGKNNYMTPEVMLNEEAFDGFAVDIWACGIILFIMLTGIPPFEVPLPNHDARCNVICVQGQLAALLENWQMQLSPDATNLIQGCLWLNPARRPTLDQLRRHPWLQ